MLFGHKTKFNISIRHNENEEFKIDVSKMNVKILYTIFFL